MLSVPTKHDVFICYSRQTGSTLAQLVCAKLDAAGIDAFLDVREHYPRSFPRELRDRISQTPCFLVLLTEHCLGSRWVQEEIRHAFAAHRKIIVVRDAAFVSPPAGQSSGPISELLVLNHISYVHEFSREAIDRVVKQIEAQLGRPVRRRWAWIALACVFTIACMGTAVALREALVRPSRIEEVRPEQPTEITPPPQEALAVAPSPAAAVTNDTGSAVLENKEPEPNAALPAPSPPTTTEVAPPRLRYCYQLSGYDPALKRDRNECHDEDSKRACIDGRTAALDNPMWNATPCVPCNCPL